MQKKLLFLGWAEVRPDVCSTTGKERVLRPRSSNVFFHRRRFPGRSAEKSSSTSTRRPAAYMGIANNGRGGLTINFMPAIAISNQSPDRLMPRCQDPVGSLVLTQHSDNNSRHPV
jgi:hypothetical protein